MSVFRLKKDKTHILKDEHFTSIYNWVFRDGRLSYQALGLLVYMLSMSSDWVFRTSKMQEAHNMGRAGLKKALQELVDAGYVVIHDQVREDGRYCEKVIDVYEMPWTEDNSGAEDGAPMSACRHRHTDDGAPSTGCATLTNITNSNIENNKEDYNNDTGVSGVAVAEYVAAFGDIGAAGERTIRDAVDTYGSERVVEVIRYTAHAPNVRRPLAYVRTLLQSGACVSMPTTEGMLEADVLRRPDAGEVERMQRLREKLRGDGISSGDGGDNTGEEG